MLVTGRDLGHPGRRRAVHLASVLRHEVSVIARLAGFNAAVAADGFGAEPLDAHARLAGIIDARTAERSGGALPPVLSEAALVLVDPSSSSPELDEVDPSRSNPDEDEVSVPEDDDPEPGSGTTPDEVPSGVVVCVASSSGTAGTSEKQPAAVKSSSKETTRREEDITRLHVGRVAFTSPRSRSFSDRTSRN